MPAPTRIPVAATARRNPAPRAAGDTLFDEPTTPAAAPAQTEKPTRLPPLADRKLADILEMLCRPFHLQHIELKPGATTQDKSRALALPYVDSRIYQKRLDYLAGVAGWRAEFVLWGDTRLICRLTILGVTKEATGEGDPNDPNCGTIAEAQAFSARAARSAAAATSTTCRRSGMTTTARRSGFATPGRSTRDLPPGRAGGVRGSGWVSVPRLFLYNGLSGDRLPTDHMIASLHTGAGALD